MYKKIASVMISGLLSLGLIACTNNQDSEQAVKEIQKTETFKEEKTYIIPPSGSEQDIQEKQGVVEPVEDEVEKKITKENVYVCGYCGGTDCPPESECNLLVECLACLEFGVIGEDITVWTNSEGSTILTHTGECTEAMQLEDEAHAMRNYICSNCGDTVISNEIEWQGECYACINNYNLGGKNAFVHGVGTVICRGCGYEFPSGNENCDACGLVNIY